MLKEKVDQIYQICNIMLTCVRFYIILCTLNSDGDLSIKSHINNWRLISNNVCTRIEVLIDLINVRDGNISCNGFTRD